MLPATRISAGRRRKRDDPRPHPGCDHQLLYHLGYTNVTTARVASAAGVSRGAMLHHFPPRPSSSRPRSNTCTSCWKTTPGGSTRFPKRKGRAHRAGAGLDAYWEYLTGDLATVYHELCVAGPPDPELQAILQFQRPF